MTHTDREYITFREMSTGRHMEQQNLSLYYVTVHASSSLYQCKFKHQYVCVQTGGERVAVTE